MTSSSEAVTPPGARAEPRRLRRLVEELSSIERRATGDGERRSAEWVAEQLQAAGASDVRVTEYRAHSTWATATIAHLVLALLASARGGWVGRAGVAAALASLEADAHGRSLWLRSRLPGRRRGHNVHGRVPARGKADRTVVVVAHHDAAHTGLVWHPIVLEAGRRRARRTGMTPSYSIVPLAAMGLLLVGARPLTAIGRGALGASLALSLQAAFSETVPGANDNASGVAGLIELGRRLAAEPAEGTELVLLSPGGEEVGAVGMAGWLDRHGGDLDPRTTLFVGLDSIGSGEPVVSVRESVAGRYRPEDLELIEKAAARAGLPAPRRVGLGAVTDPMVARQRGFRAVSLLAWRDGAIANLHRPGDVPSDVDYSSIEKAIALTQAIVAEWGDRDVDAGGPR
jgi:acetylornithine deacetylase/succinyl-diaminopimelate desuccinylase-like protein